MTQAQLKTKLKEAYDVVSNDPVLTPDQARDKLALYISAAVDQFVSDNVASDITGEVQNLRDGCVALVKELQKQRIDIGTNLDPTKLSEIISALESVL